MAVFPVPSGRTSDLLQQTRLVAQVQADQLRLLDLQSQVSTGRRYASPSDDPSSAIRAIGLQQLLERKDQLRSNLETGQSYLSATDNAINGVASLLADIRGLAVGATDSTSSATERLASAQQVQQAIKELLNAGNRQFRDRFLFSGTDSKVTPFAQNGNSIIYNGNEGTLSSFADIDQLFGTNVAGSEIFGGISAEVKGISDFNPVLTARTKLSDLYGGQGVTKGSIAVSDGASTSIVDISNVQTLGDLVDVIEANPPAGRQVTVRITATGLTLDIDDAGGGNFTVREVGGGTTAAELGIREPLGVGTGQIVGSDLNPKLKLTTRLENILGTRATGRTADADPNNDILLTAKVNGPEANGYTLQYVDDSLLRAASGLIPGAESATLSTTAVAARAALSFSGTGNDLILTGDTPGLSLNNVQINITSGGSVGDVAVATYDANTKTLNIAVDNTGATTIQTVIDEINLNSPFTASYDTSDAADGPFNAAAAISALDIGVVRGNTGNSGGEANTIFVNIAPGQSTANHVVDALQGSAAVTALFDVALDDKDTSSPALAGVGTVDVNATLVTSSGSGAPFDAASGLLVTNGEKQYAIDFQGAQTVEDLLNVLNGSKAGLYAELNSNGTGINIRSRLSGTDFQIAENGGITATQLGVRTFSESTLLSDLNHGQGVHTTEGKDFTIRRNSGSALEIDVSTAKTVGDVLNLINNHIDNQNPATAIVARLTATGNGIEIVDDNPTGAGALTIERSLLSEAAWDLGLIPVGQPSAQAIDGPAPQVATANVNFPAPNNVNTAFTISAANLGTDYNGVKVEFVNSAASGDQALVTFSPNTKTLTIDVDPANTTAGTVISAINTEGTFVATINYDGEPTNDGSGLIADTGVLATTAGGTSNNTSAAATALLAPGAPNDVNTAISITARQGGTRYNGVSVVFSDTLAGDTASAVYNHALKQLTVSFDSTATTAATIRDAITAEGTFFASLDTTTDSTNNGTGIFGGVTGAVTSGGLPEVFTGTDVNPLETSGVFNSLLRLQRALEANDLTEIERIVGLIEADIDTVSFVRADLGARQQGLDDLNYRLEDEDVQLRQTLSNEIDVDFVDAISKLTAQQASLEASLRLTSQTFQLSLLNFL